MSTTGLNTYIDEVETILIKNEVNLDIETILDRVFKKISKEHLAALIEDRGHGLKHEIEVLQVAFKISSDDPNIDKRSLAIACLLHDLYGVHAVKENGDELFPRDKHPKLGSDFAKEELPKILKNLKINDINTEAISIAILYHGNKKGSFIKEVSKFSNDVINVAKYLKDGDKIVECSNIKRILEVSNNYRKPLYNKNIEPTERVLFLFIENKTVLESEYTDLLFFLSRNITTGIYSENYITSGAKKLIDGAYAQRLTPEILKELKEFQYDQFLGDAKSFKEGLIISEEILNIVFKKYQEIIKKGLHDQIQDYVLSKTRNLDLNDYPKIKKSLCLWLKEKLQ